MTCHIMTTRSWNLLVALETIWCSPRQSVEAGWRHLTPWWSPQSLRSFFSVSCLFCISVHLAVHWVKFLALLLLASQDFGWSSIHGKATCIGQWLNCIVNMENLSEPARTRSASMTCLHSRKFMRLGPNSQSPAGTRFSRDTGNLTCSQVRPRYTSTAFEFKNWPFQSAMNVSMLLSAD